MAQAQNKTVQTDQSVSKFISKVPDEEKRQDSLVLIDIMKRVTGERPRMWGPSIVGFGSIHYKYESGREGDMPLVGFSPRKQNLTLYLSLGAGGFNTLLKQLGKHTTGKGCLYVKRLDDLHMPTLEKLVRESVKRVRKHK
jgi:hypothetical protein